jgi:RNA polymerase sigma-70 factor (ECF subfamily)
MVRIWKEHSQSNRQRVNTDQDAELIRRVQAGERSAFDLLVLKYQQRVVNLVHRYVYDHAEALDVAQETFIKAWRAMPGFRGESAFYTWLYRIAVNTAKNHLESRHRQPQPVDAELEILEQIEGGTKLRELATPEDYLHESELAQAIRSAIAELPEDYRSAFSLRELEGLSYEEIAQVMNCPIGTVRSRIFRAREMVDARLKPLLENSV